MVPHSPFDDDTDSANYGIQVPESSERETPRQWLSPSLTSIHTSNWRSRPSQNKCEGHPPQLITKHWYRDGSHKELADGYWTVANITGRDYKAFCSLRRLSPPESSPSMASDDSHPRDSPGISTPRNFVKDVSLSPKMVDVVPSRLTPPSLASEDSDPPITSTSRSFTKDLSLSPKSITGASQASVQLAFHPIEIGPTSISSQRDGISVLAHSSTSPNLFPMDITKHVELPVAYCASKDSMSCPEATRLRHSSRNSELVFSYCAVQELNPSTTQSPLPQPPCMAQSYSEEEELIDSAERIDPYLPEPVSGSGVKCKAKKPSKPSPQKFPCPYCQRRFTRNFDMKRHIDTIHLTQPMETVDALTCTCCGEILSRKDAFMRHIKKVPNSCIRAAQLKQKPPPARLSDETYAIHKVKMMEVWKHQSSRTSCDLRFSTQ